MFFRPGMILNVSLAITSEKYTMQTGVQPVLVSFTCVAQTADSLET